MKSPTLFFIAIIWAFGVTDLFAQTDSLKLKPAYYEVNASVDDNEACLICHGEMKYIITDESSGKSLTQSMCPDRIIDRDDYYSGVHKSFGCTDCHSYDFNDFPHSVESRLEDKLLCMDCHGYDESFAQYHFESIEEEFLGSTHNIEEFTCWKCHDPHSYRAFMRNADDLKEAIVYDNNMCLKCHSDFRNFTLLTERNEINIVESHDWLPNQAAHFRSVRCIECHTEINDSILIAHKVLPKTEAVKRCVECHSGDSRLMHTLYKFQSKEERSAGFVNGVILFDSFVIGANQNIWLNRISILIFALTLLVIVFHSAIRIRNRKKS